MSKSDNDQSDQEPTSEMGGFTHSYRKAMPYISSFYIMAASIGLLGWLGWLADEKLATKPLFFLGGLFLGMIIGFYNLYKLLRNLDKD